MTPGIPLRPIRAKRVAMVFGLFVGIYVACMFVVRTVPDWAVAMLGGPSTKIDRYGGLTMKFRPAPGSEQAIEQYAARTGVVRRDGDAFLFEFPGLAEEAAAEMTEILEGGGLVMQEALDDGQYAIELDGKEGVTLEFDQWLPDNGGDRHQTNFLLAHSLEDLKAAIASYTPPDGTMIAFERVEPTRDAKDPRPYWRTYLLRTVAEIDGSMIAYAARSNDQYTNRPIVLIDFTEEGGQRFCDVTARIVGQKLATVIGGRIRSAPIINGKICGGKASVTMGASDPMSQEREADALVQALKFGALPSGGKIESHRWKPPADVALQEWAARILFGLVAAFAFGALVVLVLRFTRPTEAPRVARAEGGFPTRRLLVTLLAPTALIVGSFMTLPGLNDLELEWVVYKGGRVITGRDTTVLALGIFPIITAFVLVEVAALAIPVLRWRRHDPLGRVKLGQAVAVVALALALYQGYTQAEYFETLSSGYGMPAVTTMYGFQLKLMMMVSLAAGTAALAIIAGLITEHGLGNGYVAIIVSGLLIDFVAPFVTGWAELPDATTLLGFAGIAVVAVGTRYLLRWRVDPWQRLPNSGIAPLNNTLGYIALLVSLTAIVLGNDTFKALDLLNRIRASAFWGLVVLVIATPLWAWLYARPKLVGRVAESFGFERPPMSTWWRATGLSLFVLVVAGFVATQAKHPFFDAFSAMIMTAAFLDIADDIRAHRQKLVPAGILHQPQHVALVEKLLAEANIPVHFHGSHIRALTAFFGPWAPIIVRVPAEHAEAATGKIRAAPLSTVFR